MQPVPLLDPAEGANADARQDGKQETSDQTFKKLESTFVHAFYITLVVWKSAKGRGAVVTF